MTEYRWVRWRTRHSSGPSYWQWQELSLSGEGTAEEQLKQFLFDMEETENTYSEHYRGVEGEFGDIPPDLLRKEIDSAKEIILRSLDDLERWGANIDSVTATKLRLTLS